MEINRKKLELALARNCKHLSDLREDGLSPNTLQRIMKGASVKPLTVGKLAKALGVDPADIMETEEA